MQLPTGGGKSFCFVQIAKFAAAKGKCVLILSESKKIFKQIRAEFGTHVHEISPETKFLTVQSGDIYLAMTQTLKNRPFILAQFQRFGQGCIVITDEAHYGTHTKVLLLLRECYTIGVTATPNMKDAPFLPTLYNSIVCGPTILELQEIGRLCTYMHWERQVVDTTSLKTQGGEFTEASQEQAFGTQVVYDGLLEDLFRFNFKSCMIFVASQKHAAETWERLQKEGYICVQYHTGIPEPQRSFNLGQFEAGQIPICISVGALVKGFDMPSLDLVVLLRATRSLSLFIQMTGRGSRVTEGKREFTCIDYGRNGTRHFGWDYAHEWDRLWNQIPKKRKESAMPVKVCPKCDYMCSASIRQCPNCGYTFETGPKEPPPDTQLVQLNRKYESIRGKLLSTLTPQELAIFASKGKKSYAIRVAKRGEQIAPGFLAQFAAAMNYKPGWVRYQLAELTQEPIQFHDKYIP